MRSSKAQLWIGFMLYLASLAVMVGVMELVDQRAVRVCLAVSAFLATWLFVLAYHFKTGGHWRDTIHGVHIMAFSQACALILLLVVLSLLGLIPVWLVPYLSGGIYLTVAWLFAWRYRILVVSQRRPVKRD